MEINWNGDFIVVNGIKVFAPQYQGRHELILSIRQRADLLKGLGKSDESSAHYQAADYLNSVRVTSPA